MVHSLNHIKMSRSGSDLIQMFVTHKMMGQVHIVISWALSGSKCSVSLT